MGDENPVSPKAESVAVATDDTNNKVDEEVCRDRCDEDSDGLNDNAKRMKPDPAVGLEEIHPGPSVSGSSGDSVAATLGAPSTSSVLSLDSATTNDVNSGNAEFFDNLLDNAQVSDFENTIEIDNQSSNDSESDVDLNSNPFDDDDNDADADVLNKNQPNHNWFIVPELFQRQLGYNVRKQEPSLFQRRCYGSLHCVKRLELMYKMESHRGCVNSLNFHPTGKYLASGSDDLNVVIWDWQNGKPLLVFDTKHRSNVFQSRFLPLSGDLHVVTAGRDGQVRYHQVCAQEGLRSSRKLGAHRGACHKLAVVADQPQIILSAGEDGMVLKHDLRVPKPEKLVNVRTAESLDINLYSIHGHPLNGNEFCVSGRDFEVRTYDQRQCSNTLERYHPVDVQNTGTHVTCAIYNHDGSEILTSYCDDDIYLFDVKQPVEYIHKYQGHRNRATIKGVNFFGPKSEYIVSGSDCGHFYFWDRNSEAIVNWMLGDDNGVVNCLEPHPQLPFICSSGLDWDVKVWVPSCEEPPNLSDLRSTVNDNMKDRLFNNSCDPRNGTSDLLWMLWRHLSDRDDISRDLNGSSRRSRRAFHVAIDALVGSDDESPDNATTDEDSNHNSDHSNSSRTSNSSNENSHGPSGCATS